MLRFVLILLLLSSSLHANFRIAVDDLESASNKSLVNLKARNDFEQGIVGARAWVFLQDANGKVVGQRAQWLIGSGAPDVGTVASKGGVLSANDEVKLSMAVPHAHSAAGVPVTAKIVMTRIVLADGTSVNPHTSVKGFEDNQ
ncbi:hypothetical protein [Cerasicoccus frondis]|uniref:hypothetical protein n=1 Tax=Cerasicoccus frondis TaxID=490090 RepID=UPI002852D855|nr:hypothetical protein [Cerasicoccus frondis]